MLTDLCLANSANSHYLEDWDFNDPYLVMLYWCQWNPLSPPIPKVNDAQTKVGLKIPQWTLAMIAQMGRHETVNTRSEPYRQSSAIEGFIYVSANFQYFSSNFTAIPKSQLEISMFLDDLKQLIIPGHPYGPHWYKFPIWVCSSSGIILKSYMPFLVKR